MSELRAKPTKRISTKERILAVSKILFLKQGYSETGLNQIVAEANTVKASLYQHFKSKEELGKTVLLLYSDENLLLLKELMKKYPKPMDFVLAWMRILKREARKVNLFGCPMANFRSQIANGSPEILSSIHNVTKATIATLTSYLEQAKEAGYIPSHSNPNKDARFLFLAYEGVLQIWRMSGDIRLLDDLVEIAQRIFEFKPRTT
ncbi:MAG: TetR/AcrR family transcriptional regulator [Leptospiraceae bacterium]|jgi:AcrR family transcriptional regulator|nr:TetR/AcrR family transcriptional regulator [Leptospiraceae bacterium]MCZ8347435.1 TetR/AcrR family transcriptional regulator [Leptospiraceae bacterium]